MFNPGTRSNGNSYQRPNTLPVDQLGVGQFMVSICMSDAKRVREVKREVLAGFVESSNKTDYGGRPTLTQHCTKSLTQGFRRLSGSTYCGKLRKSENN